jgi:hypothetical protein
MNQYESWNGIPYFNQYEVSTLGNVRRWNVNKWLRNLKPYIKNGYPTVTLSDGHIRKQIAVHRLMSIVYLDNIFENKRVLHKDKNKLNNNINNLVCK